MSQTLAQLIKGVSLASAPAGALTVDSSGRLGIGSNAPKEIIDCRGAAVFSGDHTTSANAYDTAHGIMLSSTSGLATIKGVSNGANNVAIRFVPLSSGSGSEAARFDASGRLLVGTSTAPTVGDSQYAKLVILGNSAGASNGYLALLRGQAPADIPVNTGLGSVLFGANNGSVYAEISANVDGTGGTNDYPGRLVFSTTADGASSPTERMRINAAGRINMFEVYNTAIGGTTRDLYIESTGQLGYITSTAKSKENIQDLTDVDWLYDLNVKSFNYKLRDENGNITDEINPETEYGLIAEEVETVAPELCFYNETPGGLELEGVTYRKLIAPMLKALQQANAKIETLEARLTALESA